LVLVVRNLAIKKQVKPIENIGRRYPKVIGKTVYIVWPLHPAMLIKQRLAKVSLPTAVLVVALN